MTAAQCARARVDLAVTLGGDGTVLFASWLFPRAVPPVLSFALGSLGFLTRFDFGAHAATLGALLGARGVPVAIRLRFLATVMRARGARAPGRCLRAELLRDAPHTHAPAAARAVLNELVVDRGPGATMCTTELFANDEFLTSVAADGVCVATPTGSTAYSLAAGGSLCHPALPGMLVSAICAHSLTFRPLVLPDSTVLRIGVPYGARTGAWVSFDGRGRQQLAPGDYVTVVTSQYPFPAVQARPDNKDWFDSIRRNMSWGDRTPQKAPAP